MDELILGVDIGTSTCEISLYRSEDRVRPPLPIGQDGVATFMPSTAFLDPNGGLIVAEEAANAARSERPGILLPSAKRYVIAHSSGGFGELPPWPPDAPEPAKVLHELLFTSLDRARRVLDQARLCSFDQFSKVQIQLCCPTNADRSWRDILVEFSREYGMSRVRPGSVIEEATCAALGHSAMMGLGDGEHLVYDFGGGTFDSAWIRIDAADRDRPSLSVIASEGDPCLGGDDLDLQLYRLLTAKAAEAFGMTYDHMLMYFEQEIPVAGRRLLDEAKRAKHALSNTEVASIPIALIVDETDDPPAGTKAELTVSRDELADRLKRPVDMTLNKVVGLLIRQVDEMKRRQPGQSRKELRSVLLSGGMCTIPYVQQRVRDYFDGQVDVRLPRVATLQDCVAIGCSRPVDLELSNRKHCSWSVSLRLSNDKSLLVFKEYHKAFDWLLAYSGGPSVCSVGIPEGADVEAVEFRDARTGRQVRRAVELPKDRSRPSWHDEVEVSFDSYGLHLRRGEHEACITDLPWFSSEESRECYKHWDEEQSDRRHRRARENASALKDQPYDFQDHR